MRRGLRKGRQAAPSGPEKAAPIGEGGGTVLLEDRSGGKAAFKVEVVVNGGVDGGDSIPGRGLLADPYAQGYTLIRESEPNIGTEIIMPVTNPLERLNGEIKRCTEVVGIVPSEAAITRLVGASRDARRG